MQKDILVFRRAKKSDLETLVNMLADDVIGKTREKLTTPVDVKYLKAFDAIDEDKNNELIVAVKNDDIVGMLQMTYIPYLTHIGSWRCLIEGVRVKKSQRGKGFGREMFIWAIQRAKQKACRIVQLTSAKQRSEALKFYESLGFIASHEGFKLEI